MTVQFIRQGKLSITVPGTAQVAEVNPPVSGTDPVIVPGGEASISRQPQGVNFTTWDLSNFRYTFKTTQSDTSTPNFAIIHVYNLSDNTTNQILTAYGSSTGQQARLLSSVDISAGYKGNVGPIFNGAIRQVYKGRESPTDTYLCIVAVDGDLYYRFGIVNVSQPAGSTPTSWFDSVRTSANANLTKDVGVLPKQVTDLATTDAPSSGLTVQYGKDVPLTPALPRGKVAYGMMHKYNDIWAKTNNMSWSIINGRIVQIPNDSYRDGTIVEINAQTGMIGIPQQTDEGIKVRILINPQINLGCAVQIDSSTINPGSVDPNTLIGADSTTLAALNPKGYYRVFVIEYEGDTRGQPWYCDLTCLAIDWTAKKLKDQTGNY